MKTKEKNNLLVIMGLMTCLVTLGTMFIKIPVPMTQGYVHLGDSMIFLSVLVLGRNKGATVSGIGSALGDLLGGYPMWIPWTLVIKFLMAFLTGYLIDRRKKEGSNTLVEILSMIAGGIVMCLGYYIAAGVMYGNWQAPLFSVIWNVGQFAVGIVIAISLEKALYQTPAKKYFPLKH